MQFSGVSSTYFYDGKKLYKIDSQNYTKKLSEKSFVDLLFGKENFFLKNSSYKEGKFEDKNITLTFKKAFKNGNELYLYEVEGKVLNKKIQAKKAIYNINKITLFNCEIREKKRVLRRRKYIINIK